MAEMDSERLDVSKLASSLPLKLMCYNLELGTWEYDWALRLAQTQRGHIKSRYRPRLKKEGPQFQPDEESAAAAAIHESIVGTGVRLAIVGEDNSKS